MDTAIINGDFKKDGRGRPIPLTGGAELLQRALIRLTVRQGCFRYDPSLGSRLHALSGDRVREQAAELVREALAPLTGVAVRRAEARQEPGGRMTLTLLLEASGQQTEVEVAL